MRKILIAILLVLLIVLAYFTIFQGISIGSINILSANGIIELNDDLTETITEANRKIKEDLQNKKTELSDSINTLLENKESYYRLANVSTDSQITEAQTEELYSIEYLYLRIGRHARNEGVNFRMDIMSGDVAADSTVKNIAFTVEGQYVGIMNFVSALEEDSELAFRIDDFDLLPYGENLQATFNIEGVRIRLETTTSSIQSDNSQDGTSTQSTNDNTADGTAQ